MELKEFIPQKNLNPREIVDLCKDKLSTYHKFKNTIRMPRTLEYSKEILKNYLEKYEKVIIKPKQSSKGNQVVLLKKYVDIADSSFIIQEYIESIYKKRNYDIRIFIQNINGSIKKYSYGRLAKLGKITTNIAQGSDVIDSIIFLNKKFNNALLHKEILEITNNIITQLSNNFVEIGLDFLIDDNKKIYLLEINSKPGIQGFFMLNNQIILDQILKNRIKLMGEKLCVV